MDVHPPVPWKSWPIPDACDWCFPWGIGEKIYRQKCKKYQDLPWKWGHAPCRKTRQKNLAYSVDVEYPPNIDYVPVNHRSSAFKCWFEVPTAVVKYPPAGALLQGGPFNWRIPVLKHPRYRCPSRSFQENPVQQNEITGNPTVFRLRRSIATSGGARPPLYNTQVS